MTYIKYIIWDGGSLATPYVGNDPMVCGDFCVVPYIYPHLEAL